MTPALARALFLYPGFVGLVGLVLWTVLPAEAHDVKPTLPFASAQHLRAIPATFRPGAPDGLAGLRRVHDAPSGWSYPFSCCSGFDCRDVPADWVVEERGGFRVVPTGEVVPFADSRLKLSPDGLTHWCSVAGANDGRTLCLFLPPRSF